MSAPKELEKRKSMSLSPPIRGNQSISSAREEETSKIDPGTPSEELFSSTFDRNSTSVFKEVLRDSEVLERKETDEGDVDEQLKSVESKFIVR